jgi:hypothetical protein
MALVLMCSAIPFSVEAGSVLGIHFEEEGLSDVIVEVPKGWTHLDIDEERAADFQLIHEKQKKSCKLFMNHMDSPLIAANELKQVAELIVNECFGQEKKVNEQVVMRENLCFYSFYATQKEEAVALIVYPIEKFLIGILIEDQESEYVFEDDMLLFIDNIFLAPKNDESFPSYPL